MPIRQRGSAYQIDLRLADGTRVRKDFRTLREAEAAHAALKPDPKARAAYRAMKRRSRKPSPR